MVLTLDGRLSDCLLLTYRTPAHSLEGILPAGLTPITYRGWAFWNVLAGRVERLRPAKWPSILGATFHTVAYRVLVGAAVAGGQTVQGLYPVRTDVDGILTAQLGNRGADFHFCRGDVRLRRIKSDFSLEVRNTRGGEGDSWLHATATGSSRRPDSCFRDPQEAAFFLRYRPLLLSRDRRGYKLTLVYRDEALWNETPVHVREGRFGLFDLLNQQVTLERATWLAPVDYRWRIGIRPSQVYGYVADHIQPTAPTESLLEWQDLDPAILQDQEWRVPVPP